MVEDSLALNRSVLKLLKSTVPEVVPVATITPSGTLPVGAASSKVAVSACGCSAWEPNERVTGRPPSGLGG